MRRYLIASVIDVEESELPTITAIRAKIEADLNRGDGIYMDTRPSVMTLRIWGDEVRESKKVVDSTK